MYTKQKLDEILTVCNKATPGPWDYDGTGVWTVNEKCWGGLICDVADHCPRGDNRPLENMRFIALARTALPALAQWCLDLIDIT